MASIADRIAAWTALVWTLEVIFACFLGILQMIQQIRSLL